MSRILMGALLLLSSQAFADTFTLSSPVIKEGKTLSMDQVFNSFGCTGKNLSPALNWSNPPAGTKSYALTVYDPDAPTGSGWWHWVVYNLPASATGLPAEAGDASGKNLPTGAVQGRTDYGSVGFGGACPPPGDKAHRYQFTLYALKVEKLDLPQDATAAFVGYNIMANSLGKAQITARYGR